MVLSLRLRRPLYALIMCRAQESPHRLVIMRKMSLSATSAALCMQAGYAPGCCCSMPLFPSAPCTALGALNLRLHAQHCSTPLAPPPVLSCASVGVSNTLQKMVRVADTFLLCSCDDVECVSGTPHAACCPACLSAAPLCAHAPARVPVLASASKALCRHTLYNPSSQYQDPCSGQRHTCRNCCRMHSAFRLPAAMPHPGPSPCMCTVHIRPSSIVGAFVMLTNDTALAPSPCLALPCLQRNGVSVVQELLSNAGHDASNFNMLPCPSCTTPMHRSCAWMSVSVIHILFAYECSSPCPQTLTHLPACSAMACLW
jgi:hypothetical protein